MSVGVIFRDMSNQLNLTSSVSAQLGVSDSQRENYSAHAQHFTRSRRKQKVAKDTGEIPGMFAKQ